MNPEATAWLECMTEAEHTGRFKPAIGEPATLFTIKDDHERCGMCPNAMRLGGPGLLVVG